MVIHLHTNSYYSFLRGTASPESLVKAAAGAGMPALALTDYRSLTGTVEFYEQCKNWAIQPIFGLEVSCVIRDQAMQGESSAHNLVMLATDHNGWASLCRLASFAGDQLDSSSLSECATGLICLEYPTAPRRPGSADTGENNDRSIELLKTIFPERLYLAIRHLNPGDTPLSLQRASLANKHRLPVVAVNPVRMLHPSDEQIHRLLTAIRLNISIDRLQTEQQLETGAFFLSPEQFSAQFEHLPNALRSTEEIFDRCKFDLPVGQHHFPELDLPAGQSPNETLRQRAYQGARLRYAPLTSTIENRLEHELSVIEQLDYASIFLIMSEVISYARATGVPTASRGSASSSLVAHCLGITTPDPVRLNLYFERFLNPARATPPDIDTDLCSRRRDEVIRYIYERFGQDKVAMVCTVSRFRARSALREAAKAYGLSPRQISKLADELPYRWFRIAESEASGDPFAELARKFPDSLHQKIIKGATSILGFPHHLSIHPGGVVITPGRLNDLVPTTVAPKGIVITQFDLDSIERLGLVKFDMLGIRGLTVLGDVAEAIGQPAIKTAYASRITAGSLQVLDQIPADDPDTSHIIQTARTIGCFQIESPGMRATLREIHAKTIDDIMVALALYRPGPLTGGLKDSFVRRHLGSEAVTQLHPALTPLLADTYGVILYQEQVLRIAHELAGLSLADADLLRRAMSHFDPGKQMETLKEKFITSCMQRHAIPTQTGERIWDLMAAFAGYGFPKAHAASYAVVAWRAAWCKTHHPGIFMAAVLANWGGYYSQRVYLSEARRLGLKVYPPQINYAQREFSARFLEEREVLFMGLDQVRDLTKKTIARIIALRPFASLDDFLMRVDPRPIEAENLIRCGAFDGFGTIPSLLAAIKRGRWQQAQMSLFSYNEQNVPDWGVEQVLSAQEQVLGIGLAAHPLELYTSVLAGKSLTSTFEAASKLGAKIQLAGIRQTMRRSSGLTGETQYQLELEDMEGVIMVVISNSLYKRSRSELIRGNGPFLIEGSVELERDSGDYVVRATRIENLAAQK